jgi:phosphate transport system permease protein
VSTKGIEVKPFAGKPAGEGETADMRGGQEPPAQRLLPPMRRRKRQQGFFTFQRLISPLAVLPAVALIAIVWFLTDYAWPAVKFNGWHFIVQNSWNLGSMYADPIMKNGQQILPGAHYGILFLIAGTLLSTAIAVAIAVPLGVGSAMFLAEGVPGPARTWISFFVEMLAAVPSVVFGLWGYAVVIPFLGQHVFPWLAAHFGFIPWLGGATGSGYGLLTSGLVLTLMIVPLITATVRDALVNQPTGLREAALALGATRWETLWSVLLPGVRREVVASTILATGRALGETMAVLMVGGGALNYLPQNIYAPITTMAAFIVSQLDSAMQDPTGMAVRALAEVALVLCVISVIVNGAARILLYYSGRQRAGAAAWL